MQDFLNLQTRLSAATHGVVGPQALLGLSQQAGPVLRNMDDTAFSTFAINAQAMKD